MQHEMHNTSKIQLDNIVPMKRVAFILFIFHQKPSYQLQKPSSSFDLAKILRLQQSGKFNGVPQAIILFYNLLRMLSNY